MIHSPESTEGRRNRTTITVVVRIPAMPWSIVLRQLPNLDQWDWGRLEPRVYLGDYSLHGKGASELASAAVSESEGFERQFTPAVRPQRQCCLPRL